MPGPVNWHYCVYCLERPGGFKSNTLSGVRQHLWNVHRVHPDDQEDGIHYCTQHGLFAARARADQRIDSLVERFSGHLQTVATVEDFLTDCGDAEPPEEFRPGEEAA